VSRLPVVPDRELGQHFLVDENILGVIGRMSELDPGDVVLEVGPGLGILTAFLAGRVALVHAVELDRRLEPYLHERLGLCDNVRLTFGDALAVPLGELDPPPSKLVANLPYSIATPLVAETLAGLPSLQLWCVMVQREVADRFFAAPGSKSYGAVSVLLQLTADRCGLHPVARACFKPPPNVDSALIAFRRRRAWDGGFAALRELVQAAFSHRRKTLANSLELAGYADRGRAVAALARIGRPASVRAEALAPQEFPRLAEALA